MTSIDLLPHVSGGFCIQDAERPSLFAVSFATRRDLLVAQGLNRPIVRLASFLLFLSRDNARSGLDGTIIADELRCGVIAELLKLTLSELESLLVALHQQGLIRPTVAGSLHITDVAGLEQIADEHSISGAKSFDWASGADSLG